MIRQPSIQKRVALVLLGAVLIAFFVAGSGLVIYRSLTLEDRVRQIMAPYAQLVSVGTDAAMAFQDPRRAQEILDTLRSNPQILEADIFLANGQLLASFNQIPNTQPRSLPNREHGIYIDENRAELLQELSQGAHLRISMGLAQLNAQARESIWMLASGAIILLLATVGQLAVLRRTITNPIASLTEAVEHVRTRADYKQRVPAKGHDEVARLGQSFNAMMVAIEEKQALLLEAQQIAHLGNWWHDLVTGEVYLSDEYFRILGRERKKPTVEMLFAWHHPDDALRLKQKMASSLSSKSEFEQEFRIVRPNGEIRWVLNRWKGVFNEQGKEIKRIGTHQDITTRKLADQALHRLNRELRAISECNQVLVRAEDEQSLLDAICGIVCEEAGYRMAWVGYAEHDDDKTLRPVAWAGSGADNLQNIRLGWADTEYSCASGGSAIRNGKIEVIDDFANDPRVAHWRDVALQYGYRSSIALPLKSDHSQTFGTLCIYSTETHAFPVEEQHLLEELAGDLAFGITTLRARDQHNRAEEQIRIAATAFEAQEGILITDVAQKILRINQAFVAMTSYSADEIVGRTPRILKSDRHDKAFFKKMWKTVLQHGAWSGEIWNRRKNGDSFPVWLNITAVKNLLGEVTHYVGTMTDITERKQAESKIEHLAFYDLLTELPNRRLLMDRLHQAMMGSMRSQHMGALLFIDLDNFKLLNDTFGHDIGDQLLIEVAHRLATCVREGDTISRLGGDEFIVMLKNLSKSQSEAASQAKSVAEKILSVLNQPYSIANRVHHSTPSIGATLFSGSDSSVDELLKQADIAMYQAKSAGRNTLRFFDPEMQANLAARTHMEAALRLAIQDDTLVIHYQAQIDEQRGIIAAEALLRWRYPERSLVLPSKFIPLAEETGLIVSIGQWVLERACHQLAAWSCEPRLRDLDIAVNVSALQFHQKNFVARVSQALLDSGAPATHLKLELELTESLVLSDVDDSIEKMLAIKELGVGFSMDDFGTGFSSLSYLTRLPLDQLKIDRSFIRNLPDSPNDATVVKAIIMLARSLGLAVIAEGVETDQQRQFLKRHGCFVYQGYLFGKPMDLASFEAKLEDR